MHAAASIGPRKRYALLIKEKFSSLSCNFLGGCFIIPGIGFSAPSARAGSMSVPRSTASICIIVSGSGIFRRINARYGTASGILDAKIYVMNFLIFSYTVLPSSTALTIVAKLSSSRTISDASFATSVPEIPIAIPISAFLSAGASLTPSPVTATTSPSSCNTDTTLILCLGVIRANITSFSESFSLNSLSLIRMNSLPSITTGFPLTSPISFAIATAVLLASPVIIITFIPAS